MSRIPLPRTRWPLAIAALSVPWVAAALVAVPAEGQDLPPSERAAVAPPAVADDAVRLRLAGEPELVMDYSRDSCREAGGMDLPDVQARAFRRPGDEHVVLVSGNAPVNYFMTGPDFQSLKRDCQGVLVSGDKPDAASFDNQEWILSVYREGRAVHALVHNEYHDPVAENCRPGVTDPSNPCWYNAITYAVSTDAGRSFRQAPAPAHVVAALPIPWDPAGGGRPRGAPPPHGYFTPSNIVRGPDDHYYSLFMSIPDPANPAQGTCLMRTRTLSDPASWRAWDGAGFNLAMPSSYDRAGNPAPTGQPPCTPVSWGSIGSLHGSLTYSSFLERYVLVGNGAHAHEGATTCGSFYSLSADLINWSQPRLILPGKLPYPPCMPDGRPDGALIYPSLIDHDSASPNFETVGARPYLYYVRWNQGLDRDLLRVPLAFEAPAPLYLPLAINGDRPLAPPTPAPTLSPTPAPTEEPPLAGLERAVVLLVDDGNSSDPRLGAAELAKVLDDVTTWYDEVSYGRARWTFATFGWFEIPMQAGSSTDPRIYDAAVSAGVNFRQYDHVLILFHGGTGFGSSISVHNVQIREAGETYKLEATVSQVTRLRDSVGTRGVIIHELGHALGLPHANHLSQINGQLVAYGTTTDVMGSAASMGHFNAYYKRHLGWLDAGAVMTATTSGTFTLHPQEVDSGQRLLVVPIAGPGEGIGRATLTDYVVEARRPIGHDAGHRFNVLDGALVYRLSALGVVDEESGARMQAISMDASPETPTQYSEDFGLMPGRTFSDMKNDIHITVLAADAAGTTVQVVRGQPEGNRPPLIAGLEARPAEGRPNTLRFEARASDPDGDALSVFWNFQVVAAPGGRPDRGSIARYQPGVYGAGESVTHSFPDASPRTVCAIVSDRRGGSATDCVDIFGAANTAPEVEVSAAPRGPGTVAFTTTISDGQPTWVWWDFGDGQGSAFTAPEHTYDPPGHYTARVFVTDGQYSATAEIQVDATQSVNVPPVADAGPDQVVAPGQRVVLDGSGSHDPDRYPLPLRYIWAAPAGITLSDRFAVRPSFTAPMVAGDYSFTLQVYDGAVYVSDEVVVTVR